jgi:hypothetical protein
MRLGNVYRILREHRKGDTMPKNGNARGANREGRKESSSGQDRPAKQDRQEARQEGNSGLGRGNGQEFGEQRQENRARKRAEGSKSKDGCLPKLFMLLLPFIAVGTYLFLKS